MATEGPAQGKKGGMYRSGVAARLAGVPVETLRVWERRYGVVGPSLGAGGQRLYTADEVRRLSLVKQCVDMGHPIGAIAKLPAGELIALRDASTTPEPFPAGGDGAGKARIALAGPMVSSRRFEDHLAGSGLLAVGRSASVEDAASALQGLQADIAVIEFATLNDESLAAIEAVKSACGAKRALVLYRFAPSAVNRRLRAAGHEVARAPSDAVELAALCRSLWRPSPSPALSGARNADSRNPPAPRFDERALSDLAGASNTVYCECPRHLVELVLGLLSFERYSAECASRSVDDAALHRDLQRATAQARALMEDALLRVAVAEGLPLPPGATA